MKADNYKAEINMAKKTILVVDDEKNIQELIKYTLTNSGYGVLVAGTGAEAIKKSMDKLPDLVILDLMLPDIDGIEVCKKLKTDNRTKDLPIIMLTAKSEEIDKIIGFEMGADDYVTKPFSVRELLARIKALLRRSRSAVEDTAALDMGEGDEPSIKIGNITIYPDKYEVFKDGKKKDLTLKEFCLLFLLMENKGRVLTRDFLLEQVWGYDYPGETRTVDVHIRNLRKKLDIDTEDQEYIQTVRGVGYKFTDRGKK